MKVALAAAALILTGCTTFSTLDKGLATYIGQSPQVAFRDLGFPSGETQIAGKQVFYWGNSFTTSMPQTSSSRTTGTVGGTPFSANTTGTTWSTAEYDCDVRLIVGANGLVEDFDWQGNIGGCDAFARRVKARSQATN